MLSYRDFIFKIDEGLIKTHDIKSCKNIIDRHTGLLNKWFNICFDEDKKTFVVSFEENLNENELEYINNIYTNLGYYVSYYKLYKKRLSKFFPWVDIKDYVEKSKNTDKVKFFYEAKYDNLLNYKPKFLYHVTDIKNKNKINKYGLFPKYFQKGYYRPDRIYFSLNINENKKILDKKTLLSKLNNINNDYISLKINTEKIENLMLYKDPGSNGVYSYNHINPKFIEYIS